MAAASSAMARQHRAAPLFWSVVRVRGSENQFADVAVYGFGERKLVWGEGAVVSSPAAVGGLLGRPNPTEEDVLHCATLPSFNGTLSAEVPAPAVFLRFLRFLRFLHFRFLLFLPACIRFVPAPRQRLGLTQRGSVRGGRRASAF